MIRRATFADAPAVMDLIRAQLDRSKYAGRVRIAEPQLEHLVTSLIAQQGQIGPQGSCLFVADKEQGEPVAFIAGILDRIYSVGSKLKAQDLFFINHGGCPADTMKLLDAYVAWARSIRAVLEISVSWTDTMPGAERVAKLYGRKGFSKCGEVFEIATDAQQMEIAA